MKSRLAMVLILVAASASFLYAHDLFIKLDTYFLEPHVSVRIPVLNGTFSASENEVTSDRITDISVLTSRGRARLDTLKWSARNDTSFLMLETGAPGTYVVGVSTRTRDLSLEAEDFNEYLTHDGILDILEARTRDNDLHKDVVERYAKHVKAVFQVGIVRTDGYDTPLGYPAEIIPLQNPYSLAVGSELAVRCLVDGKPVSNQLVIVGSENGDRVMRERSTRTDAGGVARFVLDSPGKWYVKFIHMVRAADAGVDYESKWATLTFAIP